MNMMTTTQKKPCISLQRIEHAVKRNEAVINDLIGELYTVVANDNIIDNCKYLLTLIQAAQNYVQAIRFIESFQMNRRV